MSGGKKARPATTTQQIGSDPLTRRVASALESNVGSINPYRGTASGIIQGSQAAGGLTDPSIDLLRRTIAGEFTDPNALAGQIEAASAPALRQFRRSISPRIAGRFAASGRTGSGAELSAFEDAGDIVSRNIAEVASGAIQQERSRQQSAAGVFPQVQSGELARAGALFNVGGDQLNRLLSIAGSIPGLRTSTSRGATQGRPGKGGSIGSLAGAGIGAAFGGPAGAQVGAGVGGTAGSLF